MYIEDEDWSSDASHDSPDFRDSDDDINVDAILSRAPNVGHHQWTDEEEEMFRRCCTAGWKGPATARAFGLTSDQEKKARRRLGLTHLCPNPDALPSLETLRSLWTIRCGEEPPPIEIRPLSVAMQKAALDLGLSIPILRSHMTKVHRISIEVHARMNLPEFHVSLSCITLKMPT